MGRYISFAGGRFFVSLAHLHRLDPFTQQLQALPIHFAARDISPVAHETPVFQALGPYAQATAIEVQDLDLGRAAIDKREQVPRQRI